MSFNDIFHPIYRGGSQRLRLGGDERRDRTYSLDEEYDDDDDLDRKVCIL